MAGVLESILNRNQDSGLVNQLIAINNAKKSQRRLRLTEIALANSAVVESLIQEARRLLNANKEDDANRIMGIAEKLLDNNKKYQNIVGEVLAKTD